MDINTASVNWDTLAKNDPLFIILSHKEKRGGKWSREEFFHTGEMEIDEVLAYLASLGLTITPSRALDFGCGAGRLTQALSRHFTRVDGVDISKTMIDLANTYNAHQAKCCYHTNPNDNLSLFKNAQFNFIYTRITLQHIRPEYSKNYIREFLRILKPKGLLVFQIPSEKILQTGGTKSSLRKVVLTLLPKSFVSWYRRVRYENKPRVEMYAIPKAEIESLINDRGGVVKAVREDSISYGWRGFQYVV